MTIYTTIIKRVFLLIFTFIISIAATAQEWKNLKSYKKATGQTVLKQGNWLKKDRKRNTEQWQNANKFHLKQENGYDAYTTIQQRRDFYKWFDTWRKQKGHEFQWAGIAAIVSGQFANTENWFVATFVIRNADLLEFAQQGNQAVFNDVYSGLYNVYLLDSLITGEAAANLDNSYSYREQCVIIDKLYEQQDKKVVKKLSKMAKGKGIFRFVVPKSIRFQGDIANCEDRYRHGKDILPLYYQRKQQ